MRKVRKTSSPHALYILGYTRATLENTIRKYIILAVKF